VHKHYAVNLHKASDCKPPHIFNIINIDARWRWLVIYKCRPTLTRSERGGEKKYSVTTWTRTKVIQVSHITGLQKKKKKNVMKTKCIKYLW